MENPLKNKRVMNRVKNGKVTNNSPLSSEGLSDEERKLFQSKVYSIENESASTSKEDAVEIARQMLAEMRTILSDYDSDGRTIPKSVLKKVNKAEKDYEQALRKIELPKLLVEICETGGPSKEIEVIFKRKKEIIIGYSKLNMFPSKEELRIGKELIFNPNFEKPLFFMPAPPFYEEGLELKDLNGNVIPKNTPEVYVPVETSGDQGVPIYHHEATIQAKVKGKEQPIMKDVRIKQLDDLQDFAKCRGAYNVLSRKMNGIEKAWNAALATQDELFIKIYETIIKHGTSPNIAILSYNSGNLLNTSDWNNAMIGNVGSNNKYDSTIGDKIIREIEGPRNYCGALDEFYIISAVNLLKNSDPKKELEDFDFDSDFDF
nr:hypothetical protein [uncultured Bacteroides sp.]